MDELREPQPQSTGHSQAGQVLGSIAVALLIVAGVVATVTSRLGPTSIAELRTREELREEAGEQAEEATEAQREADERAEGGRDEQRRDRSGRGRSGRRGGDRDGDASRDN